MLVCKYQKSYFQRPQHLAVAALKKMSLCLQQASTVEDALSLPFCLALRILRFGRPKVSGRKARGKQSALSTGMALGRPEETRWRWHKGGETRREAKRVKVKAVHSDGRERPRQSNSVGRDKDSCWHLQVCRLLGQWGWVESRAEQRRPHLCLP